MYIDKKKLFWKRCIEFFQGIFIDNTLPFPFIPFLSIINSYLKKFNDNKFIFKMFLWIINLY